MNAERLGLIITKVFEDMNKTSVVDRVRGLLDSLNAYVGTPGEQQQQQISSAKQVLEEALEQSEFSRFPSTWQSALEELGISDYLGDTLKETVEEIFARHQITHDEARNEIQEILNKLTSYHDAFNKIIESFSFLGITADEPRPGDGELSILMPGGAIDNELARFAEEVAVLDGAVQFFAELATGSRPPPKIKQLSSSDPSIFLLIDAATVLAVLKVVEMILALRKQTLKIREAKLSVEKAELDRNISKLIEEDLEKKVQAGLNDIHAQLFEQYKPPKDRVEELKIEATGRLRALAKRLDDNYQIDGDAGNLEEEKPAEGEKGSAQHNQKVKLVRDVRQIAKRIRYSNTPTEPVLQLTKETEEGDGGDNDNGPDDGGKSTGE